MWYLGLCVSWSIDPNNIKMIFSSSEYILLWNPVCYSYPYSSFLLISVSMDCPYLFTSKPDAPLDSNHTYWTHMAALAFRILPCKFWVFICIFDHIHLNWLLLCLGFHILDLIIYLFTWDAEKCKDRVGKREEKMFGGGFDTLDHSLNVYDSWAGTKSKLGVWNSAHSWVRLNHWPVACYLPGFALAGSRHEECSLDSGLGIVP